MKIDQLIVLVPCTEVNGWGTKKFQNSLVIRGLVNNTFKVLGSNLPTSEETRWENSDEVWTDRVQLTVAPGERAIVALMFGTSRFLVEIVPTEDRGIGMREFVPSQDYIVSIPGQRSDSWLRMETTETGDKFSTNHKDRARGYRLTTGDEICSLLAGDISLDQLRDGSQAAEQRLDRIAELEGRAQRAHEALAERESVLNEVARCLDVFSPAPTLDELRKALLARDEERENLEKERVQLQKQLGRLKELLPHIRVLVTWVKPPWWQHRNEVLEAKSKIRSEIDC